MAYLVANKYFSRVINFRDREFANSPRQWCSISGGVKPKTQKMVIDTSLIYIQHNKVWIKSKWSLPERGVVTTITPR